MDLALDIKHLGVNNNFQRALGAITIWEHIFGIIQGFKKALLNEKFSDFNAKFVESENGISVKIFDRLIWMRVKPIAENGGITQAEISFQLSTKFEDVDLLHIYLDADGYLYKDQEGTDRICNVTTPQVPQRIVQELIIAMIDGLFCRPSK